MSSAKPFCDGLTRRDFVRLGAASAFGEAGEAVVLDIPWLQLGMVLGLAVVAALVASVLPARRAATATPTQALVEV